MEWELCQTSVLSWIKTLNLIICRQVKGEIKGWIHVTEKETPHNKLKQKHIAYMSMLLNTAIMGIFKVIIYMCKPSAIYGHKSNFILTFLLEGCLVYQIYQVQQVNVRPIYRELIKYSFLKSYESLKCVSFVLYIRIYRS